MTQFAIRAERLKDAIAPVTAVVDEAKISFTNDGINISAIDAANVAVVDMSIRDAAFEQYDGSGTIGVNLNRFTSVLSMADQGDIIRCQLDDGSNTLHIDIGVLSFDLGLLDPETMRQEPDIEDRDHDAAVVFEASDLARGLTAAGLCSDEVILRADVDERAFHIMARGDTDSSDLTLEDDDLEAGDVEADSKSKYTLDYAESIENPIPAETEVSLQFSSESPLELAYELHDGDVSVSHVLAPRRDAAGGEAGG
jgi:proliferating cell nuclear antigen